MKIIVRVQTLNMPLLSKAVDVLKKLYGEVDLIGATSSASSPPRIIIDHKTLPTIDKNDLASIEFDLIVVNGSSASLGNLLSETNKGRASFADVIRDAKKLGIDPIKIVPDRTVCIAGFSVEKYQRLQRSNLSILSTSCWGGVVYHAFGLPFLSPTINLFFPNGGFMKVLRDPKNYFAQDLKFLQMYINQKNKQKYPGFMLGDVEVKMLHYIDRDCVNTAKRKWTERLRKINWDNLLVMMSTNEPAVLDEFDQLPFDKKICTVPFKSDIPSAFYIDYGKTPLADRWKIGLDVANPKHWSYNLWDLLLDGKKTPLES